MGKSYAFVLKDDEACGDHIELTLFLPFLNVLSKFVEGTTSEIIVWFEDLSGWMSLGSIFSKHLVL